MNTKTRGLVKFLFWTAVSAIVTILTVRSYTSGQMTEWFYHRAAVSGYAVNVDAFKNATKANPALLAVGTGDEINGLIAIHVNKGDRLPRHANGVITDEQVKKGRRATLAGSTLKVLIPWEVKDAKGFKFKDTFKHKGVEPWPWSGLWNLVIVLLLGLALGLMAEGFTDMLGWKVEKIQHYAKH